MKMPPFSGQRNRKYVVPVGSSRSRPTTAAKLRAKRGLRGLVSRNTPFRPARRLRPRHAQLLHIAPLATHNVHSGRHARMEWVSVCSCVWSVRRGCLWPVRWRAAWQCPTPRLWLATVSVRPHVLCLVCHATHTLHQRDKAMSAPPTAGLKLTFEGRNVS